MINSNEIIRGCSLSEARYMLDHFYGRAIELVSFLDYFNNVGHKAFIYDGYYKVFHVQAALRFRSNLKYLRASPVYSG